MVSHSTAGTLFGVSVHSCCLVACCVCMLSETIVACCMCMCLETIIACCMCMFSETIVASCTCMCMCLETIGWEDSRIVTRSPLERGTAEPRAQVSPTREHRLISAAMILAVASYQYCQKHVFYISYNKEYRLKSEKCIKLIMAVAHSQYCQTSQDDDIKDFRISLHFLD